LGIGHRRQDTVREAPCDILGFLAKPRPEIDYSANENT
jgi:hypothetical protein